MNVLVLGGTRSGKSMIAEHLVADAGPVTYVATAQVDPRDGDHRARVDAHRSRRPATWTTVECDEPGDLVEALRSRPGPVLVDSLGTWVSAHRDLDPDLDALVAALRNRGSLTVMVSEEVGLAVHPPTELGRRYVDALGTVNQAVAAVVDRALLVVAGRVVELGRFEPGTGPC